MKRLVATHSMAQRIIHQGRDWALVEEEAKPGDKLALVVLRDGANHSEQYSGQVIEVQVTECKPEFAKQFGITYIFLRTYMEDAK